jgi:hypothetical protein
MSKKKIMKSRTKISNGISIDQPDISYIEISNIIAHDIDDDSISSESPMNAAITFILLKHFNIIQHIFLKKNYTINGTKDEFIMIFLSIIKDTMINEMKIFINTIVNEDANDVFFDSIERNIDDIIKVMLNKTLDNGNEIIYIKDYFDLV